MLADLNRILSKFPAQYFEYCFAYGSGVFQQAGRTDRAMVDLIFVVNNTHKFHCENLATNPDHYSSIRFLGPSIVSTVQTSFGSNVYFNTNVMVGDLKFKYGVIDVKNFRQDLELWSTLYIAGRLHKPVLTLYNRGFSDLVVNNLESAVHAALLQLPEKFSEEDLYTVIAGLSYRGDFRMIIGEDKNKVANIVQPQLENFRMLYSPILKLMSDRLFVSSVLEQDKSLDSKLYHIQRLPQNLKNKVLKSLKNKSSDSNILQALAQKDDSDVSKIICYGICKIVFFSSLTQSLKGILTAGLLKSIVYSYNKLNKMVKSMFL